MIFWTSQNSERAHLKQPEMIAIVLNTVCSEIFQKKKRFRTTIGLSMDMKYEFEDGYILIKQIAVGTLLVK